MGSVELIVDGVLISLGSVEMESIRVERRDVVSFSGLDRPISSNSANNYD
jgi:hypothetical protein